jgi:ADP-heptose:LPS heptosyltransferase
MHLSLTEVVGLLSCAWRFVGNDSGITHLAAGMGTDTIAIFGTSNPDIYRPVGPKVTVVRGEPATFAVKASESLQHQVLAMLETA